MQIIITKAKDTVTLCWLELRHKDCNSLLGSFDRKTIETGHGTFMLYCHTCGAHSEFLHGLNELRATIKNKDLNEPLEVDFI